MYPGINTRLEKEMIQLTQNNEDQGHCPIREKVFSLNWRTDMSFIQNEANFIDE